MDDYSGLFEEWYSTALIADAAFRTGTAVELPASGLRPLDVSTKLAGPAATVEANNDIVSVLEAVHRAEPYDVVVISNQTPDVAVTGDLIGTEAVRKGLSGIVVDGMVRDSVDLVDMGLPVWCRGTFPVGPLKIGKEDRGIGTVGQPVSIGGATVVHGAWVFGDADGLVIVDANRLDTVFEAVEDAWEKEEALTREVGAGTALAAAFDLDSFLAKRSEDPEADFNTHLAGLNRAI